MAAPKNQPKFKATIDSPWETMGLPSNITPLISNAERQQAIALGLPSVIEPFANGASSQQGMADLGPMGWGGLGPGQGYQSQNLDGVRPEEFRMNRGPQQEFGPQADYLPGLGPMGWAGLGQDDKDLDKAGPDKAPKGGKGGGGKGGGKAGKRPAGSTLSSSDEAFSKLTAAQQDNMKMRQGLELKAMEKLKAEKERDLPLDLTGLAALTDSWTGSNFTQSYKPPETYRERKAAIKALDKEVTANKLGMGEARMGFLKDSLSYTMSKEKFEYQKQQDRENMALKRQALAIKRAAAAKAGKGSGMSAKDARKFRMDMGKTKSAEAMGSSSEYMSAVVAYESAVQEHGMKLTGASADELDAKYHKLLTVYNRLGAKLGALAGHDVTILEKSVKRAGGIGAWIADIGGGGSESILKNLDDMKNNGMTEYKNRRGEFTAMAGDDLPYVQASLDNWDQAISMSLGEDTTKTPAKVTLNKVPMTPEGIAKAEQYIAANPGTAKAATMRQMIDLQGGG